jgi:hypothetical protein
VLGRHAQKQKETKQHKVDGRAGKESGRTAFRFWKQTKSVGHRGVNNGHASPHTQQLWFIEKWVRSLRLVCDKCLKGSTLAQASRACKFTTMWVAKMSQIDYSPMELHMLKTGI